MCWRETVVLLHTQMKKMTVHNCFSGACPHHYYTALMNGIIKAVPPALTVCNVHLELVHLSVHILQSKAHHCSPLTLWDTNN